MSTENSAILQSSRQLLQGKWGNAILTFLIYIVIIDVAGAIPEAGPLISLLIGGPFALGAAMYSLSIVRGETARTEQIFDGFKFFANALVAQLLIALFIVLWMLLLIIPGIIAAFSYSQTFYIMADDPSLTPMQAIDKSKKMMDGYKMKLFTLGLRYVLLSFLCILTFGIGFLWLIPYASVTNARFYEDIKGPTIIEGIPV